MSIEYVRKGENPVKIISASKRAKRLYIPTEIVNDSQYPLKTDIAQISIVKVVKWDGTIKHAILVEEPESVIEQDNNLY